MSNHGSISEDSVSTHDRIRSGADQGARSVESQEVAGLRNRFLDESRVSELNFDRGEMVAWAAGLFEGEGCISSTANRRSWNAKLVSTDHDVVITFAQIIGVGRVRGPYDGAKAHHKSRTVWSVNNRQDFKTFANLVGPWLHGRRGARLQEALEAISTVEAERAALSPRRVVLTAPELPRLDGRRRIVKDMRAAGHSHDEIVAAIQRRVGGVA